MSTLNFQDTVQSSRHQRTKTYHKQTKIKQETSQFRATLVSLMNVYRGQKVKAKCRQVSIHLKCESLVPTKHRHYIQDLKLPPLKQQIYSTATIPFKFYYLQKGITIMEGIEFTLILASAYLNHPRDHAMNMNLRTLENRIYHFNASLPHSPAAVQNADIISPQANGQDNEIVTGNPMPTKTINAPRSNSRFQKYIWEIKIILECS